MKVTAYPNPERGWNELSCSLFLPSVLAACMGMAFAYHPHLCFKHIQE